MRSIIKLPSVLKSLLTRFFSKKTKFSRPFSKEKRREKFVFCLFVFVSIFFHLVVLFFVGRMMNFERSEDGRQASRPDVHQVDVVNVPIEEPIDVEPLDEEEEPDEEEPELPEEEDTYNIAPKPTPTPTALPFLPPPSPLPEPTALPAPTPQPESNPTPTPTPVPTPALAAEPSVSPSTQASTPPEVPTRPTPTPDAMPSVQPSSPPTPDPYASALAGLSEREKFAKKTVMDFMKTQGMDPAAIGDEIPPGFDSWEAYYQQFVDPAKYAEFQRLAKEYGKLPSNTDPGAGGRNDGMVHNNPPGPGEGSGDSSAGSSVGVTIFPGTTDHYDPFQADKDLKDADKALRDRQLNPDLYDLNLPTPSPIPLPKFKVGGQGMGMPFIKFEYDGFQFSVTWNAADREKKVGVRYYPPLEPGKIISYEFAWQSNYENPVILMQDVLQAYEKRKREARKPNP